MNNQRGQVSIEMVIMTVVLVAIVALVRQAFVSNEYFANMVSTPWQSVAGLIQNGVWGTPDETMAKHPNQFSRVNSVKGEDVQ